MSKTIDFLPVKVEYNYFTKDMSMWYRTKDSFRLNYTKVPYDHYIYISPNYNRATMNSDDYYKLLSTDEPLVKYYIEPNNVRKLLENDDVTTGEADISPEQRFMCDSFYDTEFPTDIKPRVYYLDIETYVTDDILPKFNHNVSDINAITIYDNYSKEYYTWGLVPNYDVQDDVIEDRIRNATKDYGKVHLFLFHKPKELLSNFIDYLYKSPPDIITAWNSKFDIPYIVRKTFDYFDVEGLKRLSPFNRVSYKVESALETNSIPNTDALIPGIDIIDLMELYKKYSDTEKSSYSLDNVAEEEIKENKIKDEDSDSTDLYSLYNDNFVKFIKYNINDVRLMVGINGKKKLLELAITIRNVTKVNFQDIFHETVTVDNLFVMEANKRRESGNWNYVLPTKRSVIKKKFTGAYVKPPIVGLFKWMADLKH